MNCYNEKLVSKMASYLVSEFMEDHWVKRIHSPYNTLEYRFGCHCISVVPESKFICDYDTDELQTYYYPTKTPADLDKVKQFLENLKRTVKEW